MRRAIIDKRYKILKKCGAGATGNVYKVRDSKDKKILALKILSQKKTSSEAVRRFKREFRLLTQLCHPNLCSVYDFGTLKDGINYFTMEYIEGRDIFKASKELSHEKIYAWIVQLCRALEYIHAKGLIHYDIKPGNVLVQISDDKHDGARVKLMDFGLAGEQRIKGGAIIKGTFPYIAPEVIKFLAVDHRADLYSLGILLYEIVTRKPFQEERESFVSLLRQRMRRGSALPSNVVPDMPKGLAQLIVQLLEFEPAARFSRANEIIKEINRFSRSNFTLETGQTLEGYLLSSRFVGRNREMELLKSLLERTRHGEGQVVLITGNAGIGKSRLLKEFKVYAQLKRSHTLIGNAYKNKTQALEPFHDIFRELMNHIKDGSARLRSNELKTSLALLFKIFPDLADEHPDDKLPELVPLGPKQEKLRNFDALTKLLAYCAQDLGELVILLEDLHWADYLCIQFLEYLCRNVVGKNIFICGTCRKEELAENLGLQMMVSSLSDKQYLTQVELKPLKFRSLYAFLDSTITPSSNSSELVRYLMEKTGGNPFFVEEIMRTLLKTGSVCIGERIEPAHFRRVALPGTIEELVLKRIADLDQASRKVVKFAATLLKSFNYDVMKRLTGLDDTELSRSLWELKSRQVLVEEDNRYRFYHATLREALNKRMAYREKRKLYYQSGKTLELMYKRNTEGVVEDLAYYFINAKDGKKGVPYGLRAAKKSSERYANEQAIHFYEGVLGLLGEKDTKRRFDVLQKLAYLEFLIGYGDRALKHYKNALGLKLGTIDEIINIYIGCGNVYNSRGNYNNELKIFKKTAGFIKKMRLSYLKNLLEVYINARICKAYLNMADYKNAGKINFKNLKSLQHPKGWRQTKLLGSIYSTMGFIEENKAWAGKGDYNETIFYHRKAYKYHEKTKNEGGMAAALISLGNCYHSSCAFRKVASYYQKAIKISEKIGDPHGLAIGLGNLGLNYLDQGYYLKALDNLRRAVSISQKFGSPTCYQNLGIGACFLRLCDFQKAKEYFQKSLMVFDSMGSSEGKTYPLRGIGDVYRATGDYTTALRFYKKSLKISKNISHHTNIADSLLALGSVFVEIGTLSKAKKCIEDALKTAKSIDMREIEMGCDTALCEMYIITKNYDAAFNHYSMGIKIAKNTGMRQYLLELTHLASEIYYQQGEYLKGSKNASRAVELAEDMNIKDFYVRALLSKTKNDLELGISSWRKIIETTDVMEIAKEIGCPEILWKVYCEYGNIFQSNNEYKKALDYYQKCIEVFMDVIGKIKNKSYKKSYLKRPDRQTVFTAIDIVERLM